MLTRFFQFLRYTWLTLLNIGFLLVLLSLCLVLLSQTNQGRDFMNAMLQDRLLNHPIENGCFIVFLFGWCYLTWYGASLILQVDPYSGSFDLDKKNNPNDIDVFMRYSRNTSYLAGCLPALLTGLSFFLVYIKNDVVEGYQQHISNLIIWISVCLLLAMAALWLFITRDKALKSNQTSNGRSKWPVEPVINHRNKDACPDCKRPHWKNFRYLADGICYIRTYYYIGFYFKWISLLAIMLMLLFCMTSVNIVISTFMGPAATAILCFMFLTYVFTVLYYFHDAQSFPSAIIIIAIVILFSNWNDNTEPVYVYKEERISLKAGFIQWCNANLPKLTDTTGKETIPIYFVAAQGGGIRGMKWTALLLDTLNRKTNGEFIKHTFCMSGVSGGGVGQVLYLTYLKDGFVNQSKFRSFLGSDYLSPVLASYAFPEMLQKIMPKSISSFDRSKTLGVAWAKKYETLFHSQTLYSPFLGFWYEKDHFNTNIPSVFINGTLAETGQRVITSNLVLPVSVSHEYIDFYDGAQGDISTNAVALNCCRFSGITPGELYKKNDRALGHIIDGGFRENTGIGTLLLMLNELEPEIAKYRIQPVIVYIKNGLNAKAEDPAVIKIGHDLGTALIGAFNSVGSGKSEDLLIDLVKQQAFKTNRFKFVELYIDNHRVSKTITLPLGWYLSDSTNIEIERCVKNIMANDSFCKNITDITSGNRKL